MLIKRKKKKSIESFIYYKMKNFKRKKKINSSINIYIIKFLAFLSIIFLLLFSAIIIIFVSKLFKTKNIIFQNQKEEKKLIFPKINKDFPNSYDEIGKKTFSQNNWISFNKLDEYYYGYKEKETNFNHIHILFAFDNNYYLLASVSIASILKTANPDSYIHFHIIASKGFQFETMKKLNTLKAKINNNTEFLFYNGSKVEDDFGAHIVKEKYSSGEYAKIIGAELIDKSIDRIIAFDGGDILAQKDLLELYNYSLENYLVRGIPDPYAPCYSGGNPFFKKEAYINGGVVFYNLKKWREMNLYQNIVKFYKYFNYKGKLPTPHQDFINCFLPSASIGLLPLKYNHVEYIHLDKNVDEQENSNIYKEKCSYFYGKSDLVFEAERNVVIRHYNHHKIYKGGWNSIMTKQWQYYAKMTGFYEDICIKYPRGCRQVI